MATWNESNLNKETCSNCGKVYSVTFKKLPLKDEDSFTCACGTTLKSWKETGMYIFFLEQEN